MWFHYFRPKIVNVIVRHDRGVIGDKVLYDWFAETI